MAGMEEVEIHSKSYLVRWVNVKPDFTISWTVQPHKKSINFGIFKHPGALASFSANLSSALPNPPLSPNPEAADSARESGAAKDTPSTVVEKLTGIGLKQVFWAGKCDADKISQGTYDVVTGESGNYAMVFDNTFSKNISKTATFLLLTYPTKCHTQIQFGAQIHHSNSMATALASIPNQGSKKSPRLKAKSRESADSLSKAVAYPLAQAVSPPLSEATTVDTNTPPVYTGVLQKRRRKKHQSPARRFFCLDFTSSTLSYYHDRNSSALRGAIPLSLAAIGANAKTREISIDSGAEVWHLKANNKADFDGWKKALEKASRLMTESSNAGLGLQTGADLHSLRETSLAEDQDWARLEGLLGRISGTRDAVRRLCLEVDARSVATPSSQPDSGPPTPTDALGDDYFKPDERRSFWKRKPGANNPQPNIFKRSVSAQHAIPSPGLEPVGRNGTLPTSAPLRSSNSRQHLHQQYRREEGIHDHCLAMLRDLDSVVAEFSALIVENKQRRAPPPRSAASRMSFESVESQEFFDAEDRRQSAFLTIQSDSDEDGAVEDDTAVADEGSVTSSDSDGGEDYAGQRKGFGASRLTSLLPPRPKSLAPLPLGPVARRNNVPAPTIMPPSLIGFLRKNVGKDLSTISMPVSANEPTSLLQRASEQLEYSSLLDRAAKATDAVERLIYVTAFAISSLSASRIKERSIRKPFNPMLGETFELVREDQGFRFIAEKVSHRPVQLAFLAEGSEWAFTQSPLPSQKFWGKSSEIVTDGKARLLLHASGERLSWSSATCFLRNIIAGEKYVEPVGTMTIFNETTGHKAVVSFKAKGMFSGRSEEVEVKTFDSHGAELPLGLHGSWTNSLQLKEHGNLTETTMWTAGALVNQAPKHYGFTTFASALNEITGTEQDRIPPTDSRLRPDQRALEDGNLDEAERLKNQLEESQRTRRKEMETKGEVWKPRWFTKMEAGEEVIWKLKSGKDSYWEERAKGEWTGVIPVLKL